MVAPVGRYKCHLKATAPCAPGVGFVYLAVYLLCCIPVYSPLVWSHSSQPPQAYSRAGSHKIQQVYQGATPRAVAVRLDDIPTMVR